MAKSAPWSERSGAERRRTYGRFAAVYGTIAVVALVLGWIPVGLLFGAGAVALAIAVYSTDATAPAGETTTTERVKPDWMLAMDDPNAPDLSLPEYRTRPRPAADGADPSPFERPPADPARPLSRPDPHQTPDPGPPPPTTPSPGA